MRAITFIPLLFFSLAVSSQSYVPKLKNTISVEATGFKCSLVNDTAAIYQYYEVDVPPEFQGGEKKYFEYLAKNIRHPTCLELPSSMVHVSFTVGRDGSIKDAHVTSETAPVLSTEILRVINGMPPWKPGICSGSSVPVEMMIPVKVCLR
ncbi:MAG: hypothetical protein R2811_12495 [Flavobacteriales bacterium]